MKKQVQQGINVILKIEDKFIGGQENIQLNREVESIDITNKINGNWKEHLTGLKTWSVFCSGVYLINSEGYNLAEQAFLNNQEIDVIIEITNNRFQGKAIITSFPLSSGYSNQYKYQIKLLGNGALEKI